MSEQIITASKLFATDAHNHGENRCYYCGLDCDDTYPTAEHVKPTFTNRDAVKFPGSKYVCGCCVASLITITTTTLIDGDVKIGRAGAPRTYSWVLSGSGNVAFSKKHLDFARSSLLDPPVPPFAIILADSGKKQIIFRSPVNHDRYHYVVQFEEEQIEVTPGFQSILVLATKISAAVGKKQMLEPNTFNVYRQCIDFFGDETVLTEWIEVYSSPMGRLAAWVCKGKDDARNENCVRGRVQETTSWGGGLPEHGNGQGGDGECEAASDQLLLDFA